MIEYWQRKFHLKYKLPDGNIWKGFINIDADTEEDLPESVSGTFWVSKDMKGWHGLFELSNKEKADRRKHPYNYLQCVITNGVTRPDSLGYVPTCMKEAEMMFEYLIPVQYENIERFEGKIEDCLYSVETHNWK